MERDRKINVVLTVIGVIFFIIGIVGLTLPVVPQVPFFLVSLVCFARGCPPLHRRIRATKLYKKHIEPYVRGEKRVSFREVAVALSAAVIGCAAFFLAKIFLSPE